MGIDYGAPQCPNSRPYSRMPEAEACPRSDTYRAIESGTAQSVFGWLFRCRTCGCMFFRTSREAAKEGFRASQMDRAVKAAQQQGRR